MCGIRLSLVGLLSLIAAVTAGCSAKVQRVEPPEFERLYKVSQGEQPDADGKLYSYGGLNDDRYVIGEYRIKDYRTAPEHTRTVFITSEEGESLGLPEQPPATRWTVRSGN